MLQFSTHDLECNLPRLVCWPVRASARCSLRHLQQAWMPYLLWVHQQLVLNWKPTLSCSRTASDIHLTLASSARTSTAHCADLFDKDLALEHSCSPCCRAFLDCNTKDTRCGCSGRVDAVRPDILMVTEQPAVACLSLSLAPLPSFSTPFQRHLLTTLGLSTSLHSLYRPVFLIVLKVFCTICLANHRAQYQLWIITLLFAWHAPPRCPLPNPNYP